MSARFFACVGVLLASEALAGWTEIPITGTPNDVQVEGEGRILVISNSQAAVKACMPGAMCMDVAPPMPVALAGQAVAVTQVDGGCIQAFSTTASLGCVTGASPIAATALHRARRTESGFTGLLHTSGGQIALSTAPSPTSAFSAPLITGASATNRSLSAVSAGGEDWVAAGVNGTPSIAFITSGARGTITTPITVVSEVQLFRRLDGGAGLVVAEGFPGVGGGRVFVGAVLSDGGYLRGTAQTPGGFIQTVAYTEEGGSALGAGFGIAVLQDGGLLGAVPNPAAPGLTWVVRPPIALGLPILQLACASPRFCAAHTGSTAPMFKGWSYWNEAAPDASFASLPMLSVNAPVDLTIDVSDSDGDPLWVTWELDAGGIVTVEPDGGAARLTATSCGTPTIYAYVSDGYAPHDMRFGATLTALNGPPPAPTLTADAGTTAQAGGPDLVFVAATASGLCPPSGYDWSLTGPGSLDAGRYTPPQYVCTLDAGATVGVRGVNAQGASPLVSLPVHIDPWGVPNAPTITGRSQIAGTDASYPLGGSPHFCDNAPVEVSWVVDGGGSGISWVASDAGLTVYSVDSCSDGGVHGRVTYSVGNQTGPTTAVDVAVVPQPFTATTFSMGYMFNVSSASGVFSADGLGCRQGARLTATVVATELDSGMQQSFGPVDLDGDAGWNINFACTPGTWELLATLSPFMLTDRVVQPTNPLPAGFLPPTAGVEVGCHGVSSDVTLVVPPQFCQLQTYAWEQVSGPAVDTGPLDRETIHVSADGGLDLIGDTLRWRVTTTGAPGNVAVQEFDVRLQHRFVDLSHNVGPPTAGGDDLRAVQITVQNREPCGATAITLDETLDGLSPILASARVDGEKVSASLGAAGHLVIGPFSLAAGQTRSVTYLARSPILAAPKPTAVARIRDEQVSFDQVTIDLPPPCGCSSSPALLLLLAALSLWPRRRAVAPRRTSARSGPRSPPS